MKKPTILITGAAGQVGSEFRFLATAYPQFEYIFTDVAELDITNFNETFAFVEQYAPQYVLNCAAYTAVDKAESDVSLATKINLNGARNLARASQEFGATMVHLSTDYVYHNSQNTPFKEGDKTSPKGIYARTKLKGDIAVLKFCDRGMVLRTSWVYSSFGNNFVKTMLRLGKEREQLNVVFDQIGTPTYARDLAKATLDVIQKIENQEIDSKTLSGVFHYSNEGVTSWYDFTKAIFDIRDIACKVHPIESSQYPTPAARPPFSVLNKAKFRATFGLNIPYWRDSLIDCLKEIG